MDCYCQDADKLVLGYMLVFVYVNVMLSKMSCVEQRIGLSIVGILRCTLPASSFLWDKKSRGISRPNFLLEALRASWLRLIMRPAMCLCRMQMSSIFLSCHTEFAFLGGLWWPKWCNVDGVKTLRIGMWCLQFTITLNTVKGFIHKVSLLDNKVGPNTFVALAHILTYLYWVFLLLMPMFEETRYFIWLRTCSSINTFSVHKPVWETVLLSHCYLT